MRPRGWEPLFSTQSRMHRMPLDVQRPNLSMLINAGMSGRICVHGRHVVADAVRRWLLLCRGTKPAPTTIAIGGRDLPNPELPIH